MPPVFIRADIYGTLKVPETFYAKALRVSTYHQLDTGEVADRPEGDLEADPKQELAYGRRFRDIDDTLHRNFWPRLPNKPNEPLGLRLQFIDMVPKAQLIQLKFDPDTLKRWRAPAAEGEPERMGIWREHSRSNDATEEDFKKAMAMYCGQIRYVDDQVGRVFQRLEETFPWLERA